MLLLSEGITAHAVRDNSQNGNIVEGLILCLQRYREKMIVRGKIK
jgi:hypothetical protein